MKTKQTYVAPEVELIEVQTQGMICASGDMTINDWGTGETVDF